MYYAEIDEGGICFHVTDNELPESDFIIKTDNPNVLGMKYENGDWVEALTSETELEPTEEEILQAELLLNQMEILANQNAQDKTLAAILLNQMEV